MKYLIYFLLFSSVVFSQNYQYAIEEPSVKTASLPTGLISSQVTETSAVLNWIAPANTSSIADYGIYYNDVLLATSVGTATTYNLKGLTSETVYNLTVRSIDKAGKMSVDSNKHSFITKKVSAPASLIASQITETSAVLTWIAPTVTSSIVNYGIYSNNVLLSKSVGTATNYKLTGLKPETVYSLTIRSIDKSGNSSVDSNKHSFTTNKVVTIVPVLVEPTSLSSSQITETTAVLTWKAPTDATSIAEYGIYNNNVLLVKSAGTATTYKLTGLASETVYNLTLRSIDKSGKTSVDSNKHSFTTKKVSAPTGLSASQITETTAVLNWTAPTITSSIGDYGIFSNNVLLGKSVGTATTYKLTGLTPETVYNITVRSIDKSARVSFDSNIATFKTNKVVVVAVPTLDPPTALTSSEITETTAVLSWKAPTNATSIADYGIYNNNVLLTKLGGKATTYKLTGLTPETSYSLTVRSIDQAGKMSLDSNTKTFTTNKVMTIAPNLDPPTSFIASQIEETSVVLNWTAPTDASAIKDYGIYNNNVLLATSVGTGKTYNLKGLTAETVYNLTVRSIDKTGKISVDSNKQSFTTKKVSAPTGLIASQITETTAVLKWTAPAITSSIADYGIYNNNVLLVKSAGTATTYNLTALKSETTYNLTVRSIDKAGKMSVDSNIATFTTNKVEAAKGVKNQLEEIEYFKAYLLPIAQKATLQAALDKYGSVRLEQGDYSGVNIVMKSDQRLYGHPNLTIISNIKILANSSNVHIEDLVPTGSSITLETGGTFTNCTFKSIKWGTLVGKNVMFENNLILNFGGPINIDCGQSGYIRNNKIIRHQSGGLTTVLTMKGNQGTPSYGNVHLWTNFLTPSGDTTDLDTLQDVTFVGLDVEAWNFNGKGTKSMLYTRNIGSLKVADLSGGNDYSKVRLPAYDIDANNVTFINKMLNTNLGDKIDARTNVTMFGALGSHKRSSGTVTGYDLLGNVNDSKSFSLNGVAQTGIINNSANITSNILGRQHAAWERPSWEVLPDPLGSNWKSERAGKPDSRAYIQNLIDTNKIAELPEGVFYISSTLFLPVDQKHGIMGKGTGKTAIVAMTDDFPIISLTGGQDDKFVLAYLTLQGGSHGVYSSQDFGKQHLSFLWIEYVVFRDQQYGFRLKNIMGFDNNFFDNISFVNCKKGFWQEPLIGGVNDNSSFVDKTVFYKGQYINCDVGASLIATRADNLNAWINCKFDGNKKALTVANNNISIAANCDFINTKGNPSSGGWPSNAPYIDNAVVDGDLSYYSCNFSSNSTNFIFNSKSTHMEGCNLSDDIPVFSNKEHYETSHAIINSTIKGDIGSAQKYMNALFVNSNLMSNSELSKILVNMNRNVPTILINEKANAYPQFLVKQ